MTIYCAAVNTTVKEFQPQFSFIFCKLPILCSKQQLRIHFEYIITPHKRSLFPCYFYCYTCTDYTQTKNIKRNVKFAINLINGSEPQYVSD